MSYPPPPPPRVPAQAVMPVPAAAAAAAAAPASTAAPPSRVFFGSLEGVARASDAAADIEMKQQLSQQAATAAAQARPVTFDQRPTLLTKNENASPSPIPAQSSGLASGMSSGHINISGSSGETFELSESTKAALAAQEEARKEVEIRKRARSVVVPVNDNLVRKRLRELGEPITLFGERIPGRRERLSGLLARRAVEEAMKQRGEAGDATMTDAEVAEETAKEKEKAEARDAKPYLTPGSEELKAARMLIARMSLEAAKRRIEREREEREAMKDPAVSHTPFQSYSDRLHRIEKFSNFSSEIGDVRPLSSVAFSQDSIKLATASWSGMGKIWQIVPTTTLQYELKGHREAVTDIGWNPKPVSEDGVNVATCSMDGTVMLWPSPDPNNAKSSSMTDDAAAAAASSISPSPSAVAAAPASLSPLLTLSGHTDRCSRLAWHPSGRFLASTSFDRTWRLWDVEVGKELLKQPGHLKPTYAIAMQRDGALVATGDLGGVGHVWDLRTGKTVLGLIGHAKQMLGADFHPDGVHLATASDDHTVRIWDLRAQRTLYTIGAHSNLISNVRWEPSDGLFLLTSSYDHTVKLWHGRDFTLLRTLAGHESRVMRAEVAPNAAFIATSAYDRTWKLFAYED